MMVDLTELQERAAPLVKSASLVEIRLFESHAQHFHFAPEGAVVEPSTLEITIETGSEDATGIFFMRASVGMQATGEGDEAKDLATFSVVFGGLYSFNDPIPDDQDDALEAFGRCVASLALWPYVRAEVARLSEQMHFGTSLTLPMLSQRDLAEMSS